MGFGSKLCFRLLFIDIVACYDNACIKVPCSTLATLVFEKKIFIKWRTLSDVRVLCVFMNFTKLKLICLTKEDNEVIIVWTAYRVILLSSLW